MKKSMIFSLLILLCLSLPAVAQPQSGAMPATQGQRPQGQMPQMQSPAGRSGAVPQAMPRGWTDDYKVVELTSLADGAVQRAYFRATTSTQPKPLIVSLHPWSENYTVIQYDNYLSEITLRDYNYIHPDFRGANDKPEACGSPLVLSDILDAIHYAVANGCVDTTEVHIMGVSGGGYATLLCYMKLPYPVKSFSAWAPISDLEAWYWETKARGYRFAQDVLQATSSKDGVLNVEEARRRSPLYMEFPATLRQHATLHIYEGVHDGYTGSVPITHSINMYNKLVRDLKGTEAQMVSDKTIIELITKRSMPNADITRAIGSHQLYLEKTCGPVSLTIFEGGHEMLVEPAPALLPIEGTQDLRPLHIWTIGDSNGAIAHGWTTQLRAIMPYARFYNNSESARTIGFDNNGRASLNALANIDSYIQAAEEQLATAGPFDYVVMCLGTNDAKADFKDRQKEVPQNYGAIIDKLLASKVFATGQTKLVLVSPPPMRAADMEAKYDGSSARLVKLLPKLKAEAKKRGLTFIDIHTPLNKGLFLQYAADGVHMSAPGQRLVAEMIREAL